MGSSGKMVRASGIDLSRGQSLKVIALKVRCPFRYAPLKMDINAGAFSFAEPRDGRHLKTHGVIGCIALTVYCPATKGGVLAHILPGTPEIAGLLKTEIKPLIRGQRLVIKLHSPHATEEFRVNVAKAVKEVFNIEIDPGVEDVSCSTYAVSLDTLNGDVAIEKQTDPWASLFVKVRVSGRPTEKRS